MRHKPDGTKPGHTQPDRTKPELAAGIELPVMVVYAAMLMACEPGGDAAGLGASLRAALVELGHEVVDEEPGDGLFGSICASEIDLTTGLVSAWADPRRESWAGAW